MIIIGISAFYHDSAACLIKDGEIISAVQEERFTRIKHDSAFPIHSIKFCLKNLNITLGEVDFIVFYEKPFLKFERLLETYLAFAPRGFKSFSKSMPLWIKDKIFQKSIIYKELNKISNTKIKLENKLLFSEHHVSHASSAFFASPFNNAAVLTMDGVGEWATTSVAEGNDNKLNIIKEINFPHSLGLLYSAFTYYTGFKVNSGEYKIMGLAPYGQPQYTNLIKDNLINIKDDGSFQLNIDYFDYCTGLHMTNKKFDNLFGGSARQPETNISQKEMDLAASIQKVTEEIIIKIAKNVKKETKQDNLCLAGGVALNCVANGVLLKHNIFNKIWIQPASGDAGGSLGAALAVYHLMLDKPRTIFEKDSMKGGFLGPCFSKNFTSKSLKNLGAIFTEHNENDIIEIISDQISKGKAVGWMKGKMEFGPRALGNRSIIADPRSPKMQKLLNLKVKYRESFRPFAPSILIEDLNEWFDLKVDSPYMLLVANILKDKQIQMSMDESNLFGIDKLNIKRSNIPSVTHVDYSSRIQTVHKETNPTYHKLISAFKQKTNCPILVNTSFNIRGEPIVCSPKDAFNCFMGTELDILVIEDFILYKENQDIKLIKDYKKKFKLD